VDSDAHDIEIPDIMPAINAGGDQIYAEQFYSEIGGVEGMRRNYRRIWMRCVTRMI